MYAHAPRAGFQRTLTTFVLALSSTAWANAKSPDEFKMPDTPAGKCAAAFIELFNSGDDDDARNFESTYRSESALKTRSIEQRVEMLHSLRERWPRLVPSHVVSSAEHALTLLVRIEPNNETFEFAFEFEPDPPQKLTGIAISGPVDPAEASEPAKPIDAEARNAAIEQIIEILNDNYVFPETAKKMEAALRKHVADGRYDDASDPRVLATRLTEDLREVCHDRHLGVVSGARQRRMEMRGDPTQAQRDNYGFVRAEHLPGNIGYIKLNEFNPSDEAKEIAAAALAFVANCEALIFDVRDNGGGSPEMIKFISSYLFYKPTHLNSFYDRSANKTEEFWTSAEIPGNRFGEDLPVYVLTSKYTFSGAEEFTYNLKSLKRGTIVGETTGGGAHPVEFVQISDNLSMSVPFARAVNPITGTNWEGVGVEPDIKTAAAEALNAAGQDAAKRIAERRAGADDKVSEAGAGAKLISKP